MHLQREAAGLEPQAPGPQFEEALQRLDGRFQFLWGIYRAHSRAEDEVVFPALEAKEQLHNVSHAYVLDHMEEEKLFHDFARLVSELRAAAAPGGGGAAAAAAARAQQLSEDLRRTCAALRASIETHVRSEEMGLWPLFAEHFSSSEQEALVGTIIGRTGAEALQAMFGWLGQVFTEEESNEMVDSLRLATRHTRFDSWLDATFAPPPQQQQQQQGGSPGTSGGSGSGLEPLEELAAYLSAKVPEAVPGGGDPLGGTPQQQQQQQAEVGSAASAPPGEPQQQQQGSFLFRPGWEDLFRMNQSQLERAVRALSRDPDLDPRRRAYLLQNLMASKYIVAQQQRMTAGAGRQPQKQQQQQQEAQPGYQGELPLLDWIGPLCSVPDCPPSPPGCPHYRRSCSIVASCCGRVHPCFRCHDEAEDHAMDRYQTSDMVCMSCGTRQPVAQSCSSCSRQLGRYYCSICRLWEDTPGRDIYHCPYCNVCRRGKVRGAWGGGVGRGSTPPSAAAQDAPTDRAQLFWPPLPRAWASTASTA